MRHIEAVIAAGFKGKIKLGKIEKMARRCAARAKRLATMTVTFDVRKKLDAPAGAGNKAAKGAPAANHGERGGILFGHCGKFRVSGLPPRLKHGRDRVSCRRGYCAPAT
jgi:hypothetical protein